MADSNMNDALRNLNRYLMEADTNLATISKNFHTVFAEAVRRATQDAGVDIGRLFDVITSKVGATKANKLKMLFEIVDEHGAEITPQKLKAKIDRIKNATVNKEGTKVQLGFEWVDYDKAMAQLERFKQQYKRLKDLPGAYDTVVKITNPPQKKKSQASSEWKAQTALSIERKKALTETTEEFIKQTQAVQQLNRELDALKNKKAAAASLPVTGKGKAGVSYKTDSSKQAALNKIEKEITRTEERLNTATAAAQKFKAELIPMLGVKKTEAMSRSLGVKEAVVEVEKIPTVFDRVIAQINQRAAQSREKLGKQLIDAEAIKKEAENAFKNIRLQMPPLTRKSWQELFNIQNGSLGMSTLFAQNAMSQKMGFDVRSLEEARRYIAALQEVERIQQRIKVLNGEDKNQISKYEAQKRSVEGVTRQLNDNEQALLKVRDRWEELNVKRQAGLINEKDFRANTQKILDEYDKLINKRKEFETKDIGQSSSERLRKQQEEAKRLDEDRVRSAKETSKILREERGKQAIETLQGGSKKMNAAVQQQLKYMQQIRSIGKDINALQANKNRNSEENALLEKRKQELRKILDLQRQLDDKQKGSANLARQIDIYNQLKGKIKDATNEVDKQKKAINDLRNGAENLGRTLAAAFGVQQIKNFVKQMVTIRGEFEMQEVALRNIIGNQEKSQLIWKKTMNLAVNSPMTAKQLTTYTKELAAFRIETDRLYDTTKMLADVSVGLGVDMQRLILAYGHTKSSGFLRGMYARQFATAGVNIYGELADYYSEIEKRTVTFKEVYERISKKMVTFADVEKVFEKLTSEGGTFYNMQQELSNTVQGQINKIKDSWQQAMNDMGSSETGVIRGVTNIALQMVKNWRTWLSVIEATGAALGAFKIGQIIFAFTNYSTAVNVASKNTLKLRAGILKLNAAMKANPWALIAAAVVAIGVATVTAIKHMRDFNAEIDKENTVLYDARQKLLGYQDAIKKNNDTLKEAKKGSEEYKTAQEENQRILRKIRKEYPELAEGMTVAKDGYVVLTSKIDEHNRALEHQIYLNNLLKQGNIFNESTATNFGDYTESLTKKAKEAQDRINKFKIELQNKGIDISSLPGTTGEVFNIDWTDQEAGLREYNKLLRDNYNLMHETQEVQSFVGDNAFTTHVSVLKDEFKALGAEIDYTSHAFEALYNDFFNDDQGFAEKSVKLYLSELETQLKGVTDKDAKKEIESWFEEDGNDIATIALKHGEEINKLVEKGLITANAAIRNVAVNDMKATDKESQVIVNNSLRTAIAAQAKLGELSRISREIEEERTRKFLFWSAARQERLEELEAEREKIINPSLDFFAEKDTKNTNGGENDETPNKQYKDFSALLDIIKKMNSEYNKLSKSAYGFAKSSKKVRDSYKEVFKSVLGEDAGNLVNWETLKFETNENVRDTLKELQDSLDNKQLWGKYGKDIKKLQDILKKEIAQWDAKVEVDVQVRIREDFARQMEDAFNDYNFTLELQNLGISEDMAKNLFPDLDYTSIGKLQEIMKDFYDSRQTKDENGNVLFSKDDFEAYKKWADKIDAEILKARKEKVKQYSKYLEKEYSERAKLEMKHAQDIAFVTANITDEAQRKNIIENINRKYKNDLNDLNWKSFKESDFYVEMMDDISSLPREYMQMMLGKIEEILQHPETLSPRALKEAINARQKVLEAQMNLEPLDVMRSSLTTIREAQQDKKVGGKNWKQTKENINKAVAEQAEQIQGYDNEIQRLQTLQGELVGYEKALKNLQEADSNVDVPLLNRVLGLDENGKITSMEDLSDDAIQEAIDRLTTENTQEKAKYDATVQTDEMNARAVEISDRERIIKLLTDELKARRELSNYQMSNAATAAVSTGQTSTSVGSEIQVVQGKKDTSVKKIQNFKQYLKAFTQFDAAFAKFNAAINSTLNAVAGMGNACYEMFDALGASTDAVSEGWKEFGNTMISSITNALTMIPMMVAAFTAAGIAINSAMGIIGLIAEALQLLFTAITAISRLGDSYVDREIENHQKKIDELIESYEELEDAIKRAMSSAEYVSNYDEAFDNLNEQIDEAEAQIKAAEDYKDDEKREEAIDKANEAIKDAQDKLKELKKDMQDTFLGFNTDDFRSMTEDFVSAWLDAYEEAGDGFDAMMDNFEETMKKWFIKQAVMRLAGAKMETLLNQMVAAIDEDGNGGVAVNREEIEGIRERSALLFAGLNDDLKELYSIWGLGGDDTLSGLAAGIQGMTEEQANVLEAYWNSVRQMTASIDSNVASIALILGAGGVNTNPMLTHLQTIADNTSYIQSIYELLTPLQTNGGNGRGFRTYQM